MNQEIDRTYATNLNNQAQWTASFWGCHKRYSTPQKANHVPSLTSMRKTSHESVKPASGQWFVRKVWLLIIVHLKPLNAVCYTFPSNRWLSRQRNKIDNNDSIDYQSRGRLGKRNYHFWLRFIDGIPKCKYCWQSLTSANIARCVGCQYQCHDCTDCRKPFLSPSVNELGDWE